MEKNQNEKIVLHIYAREKKKENKTMYFFTYKQPQTGEKYDIKFTKSASLLPNLVRESGFYKIEGNIENFSIADYKEITYGATGCIWVKSYDSACRDLTIERDFEYEKLLAKQNQEIFRTRII